MSEFKNGSIRLKDNKGLYLGNSQDASIVYIEGTDTLAFTATNFSGLPAVSDYISDSEMTTISGDIVAQISAPITDYVSDGEMTTISGDIVAQIPSLSGYATEVYANGVGTAITMSGTLTAPEIVEAVYFGDATTSGSWRLRVDNFVMKLEQYSGAEWQEATSWDGPDLP